VEGNAVDIYPCNGTGAQQWSVVKTGSSNTVRVMGMCLAPYSGGTADGTTIATYNCDGSASQEFIPESNGSLYNPRSNRCLVDPGASTSARTIVEIRACDGAADQKWILPA
jgi:hypothetical protein